MTFGRLIAVASIILGNLAQFSVEMPMVAHYVISFVIGFAGGQLWIVSPPAEEKK